MLEWDVLEDEDRPLPPLVEERPVPRWQRWWPWLVMWGLLFGLLGGMVWWRAQEQEQVLRADVQAAVDAEARAMALGEPTEAMRFIEALADPDAPETWLNFYWYQFVGDDAPSEPPQLGRLTLQENGAVAWVEVVWTLPEETPGTREAMEQRVYRLVDGAWRRTPLTIEEVEKEEVRMEHFTLIGAPQTLAELTGDGSLGLKLDNLWEYLNAEWPEGWLARERIYLNVEPSELGFLIASQTNARTIVVNAPETSVSQLVLAWPLSADAQYRLRVTTEVIRRLTMAQMGSGVFGERAPTFIGVLSGLQAAEARHWALTEPERRALRNHWRGELDGGWVSPFEGPLVRQADNTSKELDQIEQRQVALSLVLDYLVETRGVAVLGRMAQILAERRPDFGTLCLEVTGSTLEELEAEVREYALNDEG